MKILLIKFWNMQQKRNAQRKMYRLGCIYWKGSSKINNLGAPVRKLEKENPKKELIKITAGIS